MAHSYGSFRHPAVAPLSRYAPMVSARTVPRADPLLSGSAMQLLGRLMDRPHDAPSAPRSWSPPRRHRRCRSRSLPWARACHLFVLFPRTTISDVQRRMMTTPADGSVHALAIEAPSTCQAIVKGLFNHHAFRDRSRSRASTRSTGRASWRRRFITSPPRSRSAHPITASRSRCRPQFRRRVRELRRADMGCRSSVVIATNVSDIAPRDRHL